MRALETIRHRVELFETLCQLMIRRVHTCVEARGGHFEHLLCVHKDQH